MVPNTILRVPRQFGTSDVTLNRWLLSDVEPHSDTQSWIRRLLDLVESQGAVEAMIAGYASQEDDEVSQAFSEIHGRTLLITASETLPSLKQFEADFRLSLYRDVGLVTRVFAVESGLKCLLCLSGQKAPPRHKLQQLLDLLPPAVEHELERAFEIVTEKPDVPDDVVLCPSARAVASLYNDLYNQMRYPSPEREDETITSAWHNLGALLHASSLTVLSHELCRGMQFIPRDALQ